MTLRAGDTGDVVGDLVFTVVGLDGVDCRGSATLAGVDSSGVQLADVPGSGDNPTVLGVEICTSGGRYLLRRQPNDELLFSLSQQESGNPTGTLRRVG